MVSSPPEIPAPTGPAYHPGCGWAAPIIHPSQRANQVPTSHNIVQYALLTALYLLFRLDPQSAQAAAAAFPLWEALHPTLPR